jgi:hypothetical protein
LDSIGVPFGALYGPYTFGSLEGQDNQEETLLKSLNTEIGTEFGQILFTASDIGNTLILITISYLE